MGSNATETPTQIAIVCRCPAEFARRPLEFRVRPSRSSDLKGVSRYRPMTGTSSTLPPAFDAVRATSGTGCGRAHHLAESAIIAGIAIVGRGMAVSLLAHFSMLDLGHPVWMQAIVCATLTVLFLWAAGLVLTTPNLAVQAAPESRAPVGG